MKIEAGKFYRTRGGKKAFVAVANPLKLAHESHYWLGYIEHEGPMSWCENGKRVGGDACPSSYDLVEEWKELRAQTWTCYLVEDQLEVDARFLFGENKPNPNLKILGSKRVVIKEGEFAE